ncbi:PadR family transcriptional regulator [Arthrobacter sp. zg-Y750]|uniref:PadR family transcriptional regulator n=1 Tax=Arthrobacter sp. zg-Y750 TaxID=2894189 RepID=UPI001E6343AC|nr:PadR family transcriptional regulator [Arthrobacter sp. zg-Y750]MCC9176925.1 PadR family transcriptional regulator [Arthrobacter sp. zg-Y750]
MHKFHPFDTPQEAAQEPNRCHRTPGGPAGFGGSGPGGPGGLGGFGPGGPRGAGAMPGGMPWRGRGRGHHGPGGRRAGRGDVRAAVLLLLAEEPMHGYQLIQAISERTNGRWQPSPGAIYPTLSQLEDEGLVTIEVRGGRKLASLTEEGRGAAQAETGDPFGDFTGAHSGPDLRGLLHELAAATRQVGMAGDPGQVAAAAALLGETRRALYLILAGETPETDTDETGGAPGTPGAPRD